MKAFELFNDFGFVEFPEECKQIWEYLESRGKINFSKRSLAKYYREFSNEYCSAGWVIFNDDILAEFAEWLSEQEI